MGEIIKSASKIVLIILTCALVGGLFLNKVEGKDFILLVTMVFGFYFSNKNNTPTGTL